MKIYSLCTLVLLSGVIMVSCENKPAGEVTNNVAALPMAAPITEAQKSVSAATEQTVIGSWVQPIAGQADKEEGIQFNQDGSAASINMATMVYKSWKKDGESVLLEYESIGNGITTTGTITYKIDALTTDSLKLSESGNVIYDLKKK